MLPPRVDMIASHEVGPAKHGIYVEQFLGCRERWMLL